MSIQLIDVAAATGVRACFTTRAGGTSTGSWAGLNLGITSGDQPDAVTENRRRLMDALDLDGHRVTLGAQEHGAGVRTVGAPVRPGAFLAGSTSWPDGDGLVTQEPDIPLVVLGADCLPVLAWRRDGSAVGAAHAGWRGLVGGVLANLVAAIGPASELAAAIGPGVGACCYPVDAELRSTFAARFGTGTVVGDAVHLAGAARIALAQAGIPDRHIDTVDACTCCDAERFYSYRRDGASTGRHAGVIARIAA